MKCKAALVPKMGPYQDIVVEEVEVAEPGDEEVQLKVMTCTICHSENTDPPILSWCCISRVSLPVSSRKPVRPSLLTAKPEMSR